MCTLILLLSFGGASNVLADGKSLYRDCSAALEALKGGKLQIDTMTAVAAGMCVGRVLGVSDTMVMTQDLYVKQSNGMARDMICFPENVTNTQKARVVIKYLDQNPEVWHLPESALVMMALRDAFACTKSTL